MRALYIGRFQPFHLGHLHIVKYILEVSKEVIIAIGSSQVSHTVHNPFTAGERFLMIKKTLETEGVDLRRVHILPVPDIYRNALWVKLVETITPTFDVVYANEPVTVRLFKESNYNVKVTALYKRNVYSGEEIRNRILENKDWEILVPKATAEVIKDIDGVARLLEIIKSDKKETSYQEMTNSV